MTKSRPLSHPFIWAAIAAVMIFISQRQAEANLFTAWQTEEYSHGILIPFIALLLAWHRLAEIKPPLRPSWPGVGLLVFAAFLQLIARLSAFDMAAQYSIIVALAGISQAFFGRRATQVIAPALLYLIFAVPLPHLVQADLSGRLQLLSSTLGVAPLDWIGIPVFQQGNVIDLGSFQLQVVEACNGLRYLFPLMSFGYLIGFMLEDRFWKRLVIFLSTIPIAIGLNSLRITFIGLTVDLWGRDMAEGFIHIFEGWTVFAFCIALLMSETWILMRIGKRGRFRYDYLAPAHGKLFSGNATLKAPCIIAFIISALLALAFGTHIIDRRTEIIPYHPPFASFPLDVGEWRGQTENIPPDVLQILQPSDYWIANYRRADDPNFINLYMAYYASQRAGSMVHSPSNCIPGGGWQIESSHKQKIHLANGASVKVTRLLIRRADEAELVYYWFDERGRNLTETYGAKWYLLQDSIVMHRTDGALIRLMSPLASGESEAAADKRLSGFLALSYPQITAFIPGKTLIK